MVLLIYDSYNSKTKAGFKKKKKTVLIYTSG